MQARLVATSTFAAFAVFIIATATVFMVGDAKADAEVKNEYMGKHPKALITLARAEVAIIIDKGLHKLYLFDHTGVIYTTDITSGKARGDKEKRGDLKTPEGVYFFTEVIDGYDLPAKYGALAVVTDYPNPIDKLRGKTGSGIWLHATDDPERLTRPRDSRGCVVVLEEDVLKIASMERVRLGSTPIIIAEDIVWIEAEEVLGRRQVVEYFFKEEGMASNPGQTVIMTDDIFVISSVQDDKNIVEYFVLGETALEGAGTKEFLIDKDEPMVTARAVSKRIARSSDKITAAR